jgi:hypothetical protein
MNSLNNNLLFDIFNRIEKRYLVLFSLTSNPNYTLGKSIADKFVSLNSFQLLNLNDKCEELQLVLNICRTEVHNEEIKPYTTSLIRRWYIGLEKVIESFIDDKISRKLMYNYHDNCKTDVRKYFGS